MTDPRAICGELNSASIMGTTVQRAAEGIALRRIAIETALAERGACFEVPWVKLSMLDDTSWLWRMLLAIVADGLGGVGTCRSRFPISCCCML